MDIEKLVKEARPGNFTVSTVLDNLVAGDEVRVELQSGNQMEGRVRFKNSKTLTLDVPGFGFWACRVDMIAGVGIPYKNTEDEPYSPPTDKRDTNRGFEAVPCNDDPEASNVPDETPFEKTEADLEAERAI